MRLSGKLAVAGLVFGLVVAGGYVAAQRLQDLVTITGANTASGDQLLIRDISDTTPPQSRSITRDELAAGLDAIARTWTNVHDFGGATSLEVPNSDAPTVDADGEIALDTAITGHTDLLIYRGGDAAEDKLIIAIPRDQLTTTDAHVIAYNATDDEFEMVAAAGGGGLVHIASVTASNAASADFDGNLTSTYSQYKLICTDINPATDNTDLWIRTDANGGASYDAGASDYTWAVTGRESGTPAVLDTEDSADNEVTINGEAAKSGMWNNAVSGSFLVLWISNPSGTTYHKMLVWQFSSIFSTTEGIIVINGSGKRNATAAIDSIQILASSGNIDAVCRLYGIVNS